MAKDGRWIFAFVDDIAALEDILGEIILYKPLRENIVIYFVMSALYIYNNIIF